MYNTVALLPYIYNSTCKKLRPGKCSKFFAWFYQQKCNLRYIDTRTYMIYVSPCKTLTYINYITFPYGCSVHFVRPFFLLVIIIIIERKHDFFQKIF